MNYIEQDLWSNGKGAPLVFLLPGGTGTKRPAMRGYDAMPAMFWLCGYSAYVCVTSGQDEKPGKYSINGSLAEAKICLESLIEELDPARIILFGSCVGGVLSCHLATQIKKETILILWESPVHYTDADIQTFIKRANMPLVDNYVENIVHLNSVLEYITCPILIAYGQPVPPEKAIFRHDSIQEIVNGLKSLPPHQVEKKFFPGTDHDLTRGSNPQSLRTLVTTVCDFADRHRKITL